MNKNNLIGFFMIPLMFCLSYSFYTMEGDIQTLLNLQVIWVFVICLIYYIDKFFPPNSFYKRVYFSYMNLSMGVILILWGKMFLFSSIEIVNVATTYRIDYWLVVILSFVIGFTKKYI